MKAKEKDIVFFVVKNVILQKTLITQAGGILRMFAGKVTDMQIKA